MNMLGKTITSTELLARPLAVSGILFDFDGTLVDTVPVIVESFHATYDHFGLRRHTPEEIIAGIGLPLETVFEAEYPDLADQLLQFYLDYNMLITTSHVGIFLGVQQMLDALKQTGIPLAIVTAKRYSNAQPVLEFFDLEKYFTALVTKEDTDIHKPDPEPLFLAMRKMGLTKPEEVIYVGDARFDIQAANNGNLISMAVNWTYNSPEQLLQDQPDYWLEKADHLAKIVTRAGA